MLTLPPRQEVDHHLLLDNESIWLQANQAFGNMVPHLSEDALINRERALRVVREHTIASQLVRIKPLNKSGFIDLGKDDAPDVVVTDGLVSLNPAHILHANPADCGEIAVSGFSLQKEIPVIGLFHASRRIVGEGGHITPLEYMCETYEILPELLKIKVSPSARKESYIFGDIEDAQKKDGRWENYLGQTENGAWYVDFHQRTVDDLVDFGVNPDNMFVSPDDTAAIESGYFSNHQYNRGVQEKGANGLFFAMR